MRLFIAIALSAALSLLVSCSSGSDQSSAPLEPGLSFDTGTETEVCRANMSTIAAQQTIFYAMNGFYASSLEELGLSGMVCPSCETGYIVRGDSSDFTVNCPLPFEPTHGWVINGVASWAGQGEESCRSSMVVIASANAIFFAEHDRYAYDLEELELENLTCPGCGEPYIYYLFEEQGQPGYHVECGMPSDPNHGYVRSGVPSWQ